MFWGEMVWTLVASNPSPSFCKMEAIPMSFQDKITCCDLHCLAGCLVCFKSMRTDKVVNQAHPSFVQPTMLKKSRTRKKGGSVKWNGPVRTCIRKRGWILNCLAGLKSKGVNNIAENPANFARTYVTDSFWIPFGKLSVRMVKKSLNFWYYV